MPKKKIQLEDCPELIEISIGIIHSQLMTLKSKKELSPEDIKNLIALTALVKDVYKDYRAEVAVIEKEIKSLPKQEILSIVNNEAKKHG